MTPRLCLGASSKSAGCARAVIGLFPLPAKATMCVGLRSEGQHTLYFHTLRQQTKKPAWQHNLALADFVREPVILGTPAGFWRVGFCTFDRFGDRRTRRCVRTRPRRLSGDLKSTRRSSGRSLCWNDCTSVCGEILGLCLRTSGSTTKNSSAILPRHPSCVPVTPA